MVRVSQVYNADVETGKVVNEWSFKKDGAEVAIKDIVNDTRAAQLDDRDTFLGIGQNRCCCSARHSTPKFHRHEPTAALPHCAPKCAVDTVLLRCPTAVQTLCSKSVPIKASVPAAIRLCTLEGWALDQPKEKICATQHAREISIGPVQLCACT